MRKVAAFVFSCSVLLFGQSNNGELRLRVTEPSGLAVRTAIQLACEANQYLRVLITNEQGILTVQRLPFGVYQLQIKQPGFAEVLQTIDAILRFQPRT